MNPDDIEELDLGADGGSDADAPPPAAPTPPRKRPGSRGKSRSKSRSGGSRPAGGARPLTGAAAQAQLTKQLAAMHETIATSVIVFSMALPSEVRPTDQEIDAIFQPLEHIYVRHADAFTPNPDVPCALAAAYALVKYLSRIGVFKRGMPRFMRQPAAPSAAPTNLRPMRAATPPPAPASAPAPAPSVDDTLSEFWRENVDPKAAQAAVQDAAR